MKKVLRAFPASLRKKTAVLSHIVANLVEVEKQNLVSVVTKAKPNKLILLLSKDTVKIFFCDILCFFIYV